jgi:hypothetical protein
MRFEDLKFNLTKLNRRITKNISLTWKEILAKLRNIGYGRIEDGNIQNKLKI